MWETELQKKKTLIDVYPDWLLDGVFHQLDSFDVAWKDYADSDSLNLSYYGNRSGGKIISKMVERLLENGELTSQKKSLIAKMLYQKYGYAWNKAFTAMLTNYAPLENYNKTIHEHIVTEREGTDTETRNLESTNTGTVNEQGKNTGTDTFKKTGSDLTENRGSTTNENSSSGSSSVGNKIYGFDTVEASNREITTSNSSSSGTSTDRLNTDYTTTYNTETKETVDLSNESEITNNLKNTNTGTVEVAEDKTADTTRDYTEKGNIGVTTSQQMLESELRLRFDWKFFDLVFKDIDSELTSTFKEVF